MSNIAVAASDRTIYLSQRSEDGIKGGNDNNIGTSPEFAVATLERAIELVAQFNPELTNGAAIISQDYNRLVLTSDIDLPDDVQIDLPNTTIVALGEVRAGGNAQFTCQVMLCGNTNTNIGYTTNGKLRTGFTARNSVIGLTPNITLVSIDNASDETFFSSKQMIVRGDNSDMVSITATGFASENLDIGVMDIGDANFTPNNCRGYVVDVGQDVNIFLRGGKIKNNGGTGHTAMWVDSGKVVDEGRFINMTQGNQAILLNSSDARYVCNAAEVNGDILTLIGSYFQPNINSFDYSNHTAFILGDADGYIGGIRLGTYVEGDADSYTFVDPRVNTQEDIIGTFRIEDLTARKIDSATFSYYQQSTFGNPTANISIVDAATGLTVYFSKSNANGATGFSDVISLDPDTPLPASGSIDLSVIVNRSGGFGNPIQDLSATITTDKI